MGRKSDIFSELFSDEVRREEQTVCALSVLFTAWHVQVPVRPLQSFSIKEKKKTSEMLFDTLYIPSKVRLEVCLGQKSCSRLSVEILHKSLSNQR